MHTRRSFALLLALLLPITFSPVVTAQWMTWPPRPRTNLTQCILDIRNHTLPQDPLLIAMGGQQTFNPFEAVATNDDTCKLYCGDSSNAFVWSHFSPQFQGWLLPFLAMLAQLPYESGGTWHDFMSLLLTVGSPLLAMYSLTLTILNSRYLKRRLDEAFPGDDIRLRDLKKNILHTLKHSQQEPFQLGNLGSYPTECKGGKLKDAEQHWWYEVQKATSSKERWFTASLATQAVTVFIAFSFTWVDAFGSEHIGTKVTAFGLAIALSWSWVAVIVLGWYFAGVSISNHPISEAIKQANRLHPNALPRIARFTAPKELEYFALLRRIAGDLERTGPLYNYAKAFVWTYSVDHLVETLRNHILSQPAATTSSSTSSATVASVSHTEYPSPASIPPPTNSSAPNIAVLAETTLPEDTSPTSAPPPTGADAPNMAASAEASLVEDTSLARITPPTNPDTPTIVVSAETSLPEDTSLTNPPTSVDAPNTVASSKASSLETTPWSGGESSYRYYQPETPGKRGWKRSVLQRMFWSAISATVLNFATVGAAFCLDFFTPSVGLGCRSGGVLIYCGVSYIIWMLMVASAWVSNHWSVRAATRRIEKDQLPGNLYLLGVVAVVLRLVGKGLAILNSVWIVMHCLFEFTGFYDRCFCMTNRGTTPWLWLDDADIRGLNNVQERWIGFAVLTATVCLAYILFIGFWTRKHLQ